jgi:hypothetical protein
MAQQDTQMTDYVLISRHIVNVTIGGLTKSYSQKKRGEHLTRAYVAYMFCLAQGWPVQRGEKWAVFYVKEAARLPDLFELLEWFDAPGG